MNYSSWIEQPIMIYENGLPVGERIVDEEGIATFDITSMKSGEQKTYFFKQIKKYT